MPAKPLFEGEERIKVRHGATVCTFWLLAPNKASFIAVSFGIKDVSVSAEGDVFSLRVVCTL